MECVVLNIPLIIAIIIVFLLGRVCCSAIYSDAASLAFKGMLFIINNVLWLNEGVF